MKVKEVMTQNVDTVTPDTSVTDVARLMRDGDYGIVPVVDNKVLLGTVTDRDIVVRCVAASDNLAQVKALDAMSSEPSVCNADQDVTEVAALMRRERVRRLPVLSGAGDLIGIVALAGSCDRKGGATRLPPRRWPAYRARPGIPLKATFDRFFATAKGAHTLEVDARR